VREFIYGLLVGAAVMFGIERFDPVRTLAYLNDATASAVRSTSGYGGANKPKDARP